MGVTLLKKRIGMDSVIFLFPYSPGENLGAIHDLPRNGFVYIFALSA